MQEEDDNMTEIANSIFSDLLSENPDQAVSAFGPHRVVPDRWKGMSEEQLKRIREEQMRQVEEKKVNITTLTNLVFVFKITLFYPLFFKAPRGGRSLRTRGIRPPTIVRSASWPHSRTSNRTKHKRLGKASGRREQEDRLRTKAAQRLPKQSRLYKPTDGCLFHAIQHVNSINKKTRLYLIFNSPYDYYYYYSIIGSSFIFSFLI